MTGQESYAVALFESVSHALRAEKLVKAKNIPCKLIPVPRHISSDCGVCLRFSVHDMEKVQSSMTGKVAPLEIISL